VYSQLFTLIKYSFKKKIMGGIKILIKNRKKEKQVKRKK
jgi:hypothetical protein